MTSQDTTPPEFAATAEALRLYSLHGSFSLFTLTCLLHRADPAKVTEVTTFEWAMYERKLGEGTFVRTGTASQAAYLARLTYTPEAILGDLIGGTVKRLQTAACQVDLKAHVTREKAAQLADLLGMELPPEIGLTFPAKAPEPAPASTTTDSPDAPPKLEEKPVATSERNSLLVIIAVLCKEAKMEYTRHAKTAALIADTAEKMGLAIGESTIEGHLKKIPDALRARMK